MGEPRLEQLVDQIEQAIGAFSTPVSAEDKNALMLSGMSLVAHFLARCDGSPRITPQLVLKAVNIVVEKRGLIIAKLDNK